MCAQRGGGGGGGGEDCERHCGAPRPRAPPRQTASFFFFSFRQKMRPKTFLSRLRSDIRAHPQGGLRTFHPPLSESTHCDFTILL